jgi:hypothetical protein
MGSSVKLKPADWPTNIPEPWAEVEGSGLYTSQEVKDTEALPRVIAGEDGLLRLLNGRPQVPQAAAPTEGENSQPERNRNAVHSIWGYGSYPHFRDGIIEDIRRWDADKKPDYIIVGDMRGMLDNLADLWGLNETQRSELQDHGHYAPTGPREGFVYFNTDMLIPGRGPVSFKISLVDTRAFFAMQRGKPVLEYSQIRLKDATPEHLLWSRGEEERTQSLTHLEAIRDELFEQGYRHIGGGLLRSLLYPPKLFRHRSTGNDMVRSFFTMSYRLEWYRFWENLWGPFDKGKKLFNERREDVRSLLVPPLQRFALRHSDSISLKLYGRTHQEPEYDSSGIIGKIGLHLFGRTITPDQITPENIYDVVFSDFGLSRGSLGRFRTYWKGFPAYLRLNKRGYHSYKQHGLPSNLFSHAYYVQPPSEYAGRKARGILEKGGRFGLFLNRVLASDWAKRNRALRQITLDSQFSPVYYTQIAPYINDLFAGDRNGSKPPRRPSLARRIIGAITFRGAEKKPSGFPQRLRLTEGEYDSLMRWFEASPNLRTLKNNELLRFLNVLRTSSTPEARSGATKLFRWIEQRPRLEPEVGEYIRSLRLGEPPSPPPPSSSGPGSGSPASNPSSPAPAVSSGPAASLRPLPADTSLEESPWEIKQIIEAFLPAINLLAAGNPPRMYHF